MSDRFWSKVDRRGSDDCWPWMAGRYGGGYGQFWVGELRRNVPAQRVAFFIEHGRWPLIGRHTCDNPPCCNPRHVIDGSTADNMADREARGRTAYADRNGSRLHPERVARGERHGLSKLTESEVREIRRRRAGGQSLYQIGRAFAVTKQAVAAIVKSKTWRHVA